LISLRGLTSLSIGTTGISKKGFAALQRDLNLSFIGITNQTNQNFTDDDLSVISNSLGLIDLYGNKITGITTRKLGKLDDLWWVDIRNCPKVTAHDSNALEARLREGQVWSDHNKDDQGDTADSEWYFEPAAYDRSWTDSSFKFIVAEWLRHFAHPESRESFLAP
jgi:hypothetical protein